MYVCIHIYSLLLLFFTAPRLRREAARGLTRRRVGDYIYTYYGMLEVKQTCEKHLTNLVEVENVEELLQEAERFQAGPALF